MKIGKLIVLKVQKWIILLDQASELHTNASIIIET